MTHLSYDVQGPARPDGPDVPDLRAAAHTLARLRTATAVMVGALAALGLAGAVVLALAGFHVLSPERPARGVTVLLSAPALRHHLAEDMVDDLDATRAAPLTAEERAALADALQGVMASPTIHQRLSEMGVVDGRLDTPSVADALESELRLAAVGRPPEVEQVLLDAAVELPRELEAEGSTLSVSLMQEQFRESRLWVLLIAAVSAVPGLIAGAVTLAIARRRSLAAVLVCSAALALAFLALTPGGSVLGFLPGHLGTLGHVMGAVGRVAGANAMWSLLLAAAVPPGAWWALRSLRSDRGIAAPTT